MFTEPSLPAEVCRLCEQDPKYRFSTLPCCNLPTLLIGWSRRRPDLAFKFRRGVFNASLHSPPFRPAPVWLELLESCFVLFSSLGLWSSSCSRRNQVILVLQSREVTNDCIPKIPSETDHPFALFRSFKQANNVLFFYSPSQHPPFVKARACS